MKHFTSKWIYDDNLYYNLNRKTPHCFLRDIMKRNPTMAIHIFNVNFFSYHDKMLKAHEEKLAIIKN